MPVDQVSGDHPLILLVDDEREFAAIMAKRLGKRGYQVLTANSGLEAVRLARDHDFLVAVLDVKMEGMDGLETLKTLRMLLPALQIIMLTGHGSADIARQAMAQGARDYLTKPCELNELMAKIEQALAGA
ncbi:MAG: response regulator [Pseudomonadota bacterium]